MVNQGTLPPPSIRKNSSFLGFSYSKWLTLCKPCDSQCGKPGFKEQTLILPIFRATWQPVHNSIGPIQQHDPAGAVGVEVSSRRAIAPWQRRRAYRSDRPDHPKPSHGYLSSRFDKPASVFAIRLRQESVLLRPFATKVTKPVTNVDTPNYLISLDIQFGIRRKCVHLRTNGYEWIRNVQKKCRHGRRMFRQVRCLDRHRPIRPSPGCGDTIGQRRCARTSLSIIMFPKPCAVRRRAALTCRRGTVIWCLENTNVEIASLEIAGLGAQL